MSFFLAKNFYIAITALLAYGVTSGAFLLSPPRTTTLVSRQCNQPQIFLSIPTQLAAKDDDEEEEEEEDDEKEEEDDDEEEFHSRDPAETTPQLLKGIWEQIAQGGSMVKGVSLCLLQKDLWCIILSELGI